MAVNTPIQGTAADVVKLAMSVIARRLADSGATVLLMAGGDGMGPVYETAEMIVETVAARGLREEGLFRQSGSMESMAELRTRLLAGEDEAEAAENTKDLAALAPSLSAQQLARAGHDVTLFASGDSQTAATLVPVVPRGQARIRNGLAGLVVTREPGHHFRRLQPMLIELRGKLDEIGAHRRVRTAEQHRPHQGASGGFRARAGPRG